MIYEYITRKYPTVGFDYPRYLVKHYDLGALRFVPSNEPREDCLHAAWADITPEQTFVVYRREKK